MVSEIKINYLLFEQKVSAYLISYKKLCGIKKGSHNINPGIQNFLRTSKII
jgi:hypothetical protein